MLCVVIFVEHVASWLQECETVALFIVAVVPKVSGVSCQSFLLSVVNLRKSEICLKI